MLNVGRSAIKADQCVTVRGTSSNNGATVKATSVNLSKPTSTGCNRGFPGHPLSLGRPRCMRAGPTDGDT
jgi:hypothetical protein